MARKNQVVVVSEFDALQQTGAITFNAVGNPDIAALKVADIVNHAMEGLWDMMPAEVRYPVYHGYRQKVQDAAALTKNEDGKSATPKEKFDEMQAVVDHLNGFKPWTARQAGAIKIANEKVDELTKELEALKRKYAEAGFTV